MAAGQTLPLTLNYCRELENDPRKFDDLPQLIAAVEELREKHDGELDQIKQYVHGSELLAPPAQLIDAEAQQMMELYQPRKVDDAINDLKEMREKEKQQFQQPKPLLQEIEKENKNNYPNCAIICNMMVRHCLIRMFRVLI